MTTTTRNLARLDKITRGETKVLDGPTGRISAVVSTEAKDRDGDIARVEGWQLDNFMKLPQMIDSHRYATIEAVIGRWDVMEVRGKSLVGEGTYFIDSPNPRVADLARHAMYLAKNGLGAFSVGFIPDMSKAKELPGSDSFFPSFEFKGQELLEVSQVSVPANPEALQRMKGVHPEIDNIVDAMLDTMPQQGDAEDGLTSICLYLSSLGMDGDLITKIVEDKRISIIIDVDDAPLSDPTVDAVMDAVGAQLDTNDISNPGKAIREGLREALHG